MTASPASAPQGLAEGAWFAGYRIERLLGAGSLGAVYSAVDPQGRSVALKTFSLSEAASQAERDTIVRETRLYRELAHPHIVTMFEAGVHGGRAYIAMERVAGRNLASHTQPGRLLPIGATLSLGAKVASALAHAHHRGIVHRDVKPDNILIDWPGPTVKLADFGIASLGDMFRTQTGVVPGTPFYMSPEQLSGGVIDARTDLYALGVVLFEALCGCRPHAATSLGALLRQVASQDAPRPDALNPDVPAPVSAFVARLMSRQPALRPADAAGVSAALERLAAG